MSRLSCKIVGIAIIVAGCDTEPQADFVAPTVIVAKKSEAFVSLSQVCSDVTVTSPDGQAHRGQRACDQTKKPCEAYGDIMCMMLDADLYGVFGKNVVPENIKEGVPIGTEMGRHGVAPKPCVAEGEVGCQIGPDKIAVAVADVPAKVVAGQQVAGVSGSVTLGVPDPSKVLASDPLSPGTITACNRNGQTSCLATPRYPSFPSSQLRPEVIRQGVTIAAVTGTYNGKFAACGRDGEADCVTSPAFVSAHTTSLAAASIRDQVTIGGVTGSYKLRPAACAAGRLDQCVTTASFPAADYSRITVANLKGGTSLAGVSGQYPSPSHPLAGSSPTTDLAASNFAARLRSASPFEYWNAAGERQVSTGDAALDPANIASGVALFGLVGTAAVTPPPCTAARLLDCVTGGSFVSYPAAKLNPGNIKTAATIVGAAGPVVGAYPSAAHPLPAASPVADLTAATLATRLSSAAPFEYWDAAGNRHQAQGTADLSPGNLAAAAEVFGVTGTRALSPALCNAATHTSCVTSASFPAYDPAVLHAGVIKKGVTIGLVSGGYPSVAHPLAGSSGAVADLTTAGFASALRSPSTFEYFDSIGTHYTGAGSTLFAPSHIKNGVTMFGVTGAITAKSADCTSANSTGCVATTDFPAFHQAKLIPANVKNAATVMGVTGTYPSPANPFQDASATADLGDASDLQSRAASTQIFEFWDATGMRYSVQGDANLAPENIASGVTILAQTGTVSLRAADCSSEGEDSCVTTSRYLPYSTTSLTPGLLKSGESLGGVTGQYPSAAFPLPNASAQPDLNSGKFAGQVTSAGNYEYWDSAGKSHVMTITANLSPAKVLKDQTIFGVTGLAAPPKPPCNSALLSGCLTSAAFPSYAAGSLTEGEVRIGTTIAGIAGKYPSAAYKLPGAAATKDLTSANFIASLKSPETFEFWDAAGNHHQGQGTALLRPDSLRKDVEVFGVAGVLIPAGLTSLTPERVRFGVVIDGTRGAAKMSCRNVKASPSESYKTIDDHVAGGAKAIAGPTAEDNYDYCSTDVFVDATPGGCTAAKNCIYRDTLTGAEWGQMDAGTDHNWLEARTYCESTFGAEWRIPTHKELITLYVHGFGDVHKQVQALTGSATKYPESRRVWTATTNSGNKNDAWVVNLRTMTTTTSVKTARTGLSTYCTK